MKYKIVPREIEAVQWTLGDGNNDVSLEHIETVAHDSNTDLFYCVVHAFLELGDGVLMSIQPTDWIITDGKRKFAVSDEEFKENFKPLRGKFPSLHKKKVKIERKIKPKPQFKPRPKKGIVPVNKICQFKECGASFVDKSKPKTRKYCDFHCKVHNRIAKPRNKNCTICGDAFKDETPSNNLSRCIKCRRVSKHKKIQVQ